MPHYTTPALPPDANGDVRYPQEASWPIKARCIRCAGRKVVVTATVVHRGFPVPTQPCTNCNERGYYFLPLGD